MHHGHICLSCMRDPQMSEVILFTWAAAQAAPSFAAGLQYHLCAMRHQPIFSSCWCETVQPYLLLIHHSAQLVCRQSSGPQRWPGRVHRLWHCGQNLTSYLSGGGGIPCVHHDCRLQHHGSCIDHHGSHAGASSHRGRLPSI